MSRCRFVPHHPFSRGPLSAAVLSLALTACGGGDDAAPAVPPAATPTSVVSGVAAIGQPIAAGTVTARCTGAASPATATTSSAGAWTMSLSTASLPCALQVTGGTAGGVANTQVLHSYAAAAGVANITPLTDLAVALGASGDPAAWFAALDATHPPALATALTTAGSTVAQALSTAHYDVPGGTAFDPFTAAFSAAPGDAYDGLLDAFATTLAAHNTSYPQLLTQVLSAAPGGIGISLPAFGVTVPGDPPATGSAGPIALTAKSGVQPADIAPLVGSYTGTFGSSTATGQAAVPTSTCGIAVQSDGTVTLTAGDRAISALMSGDVGDQILKIGTIDKAIAFTFATNANVIVELVRGHVVGATATDANDALSCTRVDPHLTTAGNANVQTLFGATASDVDAAMVGSYSNGACTVTLSAGGTIHLVSGEVDVQATLGGEETDVIVVPTGTQTAVLQAEQATRDGRQTQISLTREEAVPSLGLGTRYSADARIVKPRPFQVLANCTSLIKQ